MSSPRPPHLPKQRQPLCPYCEYNLTGVFDRIAKRSVRCPECGEEMEGHEVRWSGGESDWSLVIGLRGAARHLLLRGAFVLALLAGSVLLAEWLGRNSIMFWIPAIIQIAIGVGCGKLLLNGLEDAAGFFSVLLPIVATIVIAAIAVLVAIVMPLFMTITSAPVVSMLFVACFAAAITMFFNFMSEVA